MQNKRIVLYCIVLYCIVLYCIVLYCIVLIYFRNSKKMASFINTFMGMY